MSNLPGMAYRCRNDPQWSMEFVSDGCSQLTGYPASVLLENRGVAYGDIIHPMIDRRCGTKFSRPLPNGDDFSWSTAFTRLKVKKSGSGSRAWASSLVPGNSRRSKVSSRTSRIASGPERHCGKVNAGSRRSSPTCPVRSTAARPIPTGRWSSSATAIFHSRATNHPN